MKTQEQPAGDSGRNFYSRYVNQEHVIGCAKHCGKNISKGKGVLEYTSIS
jgi:hypothetical protein